MAYRARNKSYTLQLGHLYGMVPRHNSCIPKYGVPRVTQNLSLGPMPFPLQQILEMVKESEEGQYSLRHLPFLHFYWSWMLVCELEDPRRVYLNRKVLLEMII